MPDEIKEAKQSWAATLVTIVIVVASLYMAKGILMPLTLAALLSFMLSPLCHWFETRGLGRVPAVLLTVFLGFSILGVMVWTAVVQVIRLEPQIPIYTHNLEAKLNSLNEYAVAALSKVTASAEGFGTALSHLTPATIPTGTIEQPFAVRVIAAPTSPLQVFGGIYGALLEVLGTTGIVLVMVMFFLLRREDLRDRFIHLVGKGHVTLTTQMLEDAGARVSRYLSLLFLINLAFAVSVGLGLYLIGIPNAVLWGILAGLLRFIPYIGPWVAAAMPIALSMAISPGWVAPSLTIGLFVVLELFNNNLLEPWVYGTNTGVSAVAVLLAAVFWMWLWGPVGLLLATPLTVCILVVGKHIPQLSFLDVLLGNEPVFEPKTRLYQRLLAGDLIEAGEVFEECLQGMQLVEVYDTVLIPALAMAKTHWQLGELSDRKYEFIIHSVKELAEGYAEDQLAGRVPPTETQALEAGQAADQPIGAGRAQLSVVCLPARTEADEITASMLAQVLEPEGCTIELIPISSLSAEGYGLADRPAADLVCVSATPPVAIMHARHLCRNLRRGFPEVNLIVGLWDVHGDLSKVGLHIGCGAVVVGTLSAAQAEIRRLISDRKNA